MIAKQTFRIGNQIIYEKEYSSEDVKLPAIEQWGPSKWKELHLRTKQPGFDLAFENNWLSVFSSTIPCGECRRHWKEALDKHPPVLTSSEDYFRWTIEIHNVLNASLGKPEMSLSEANSLYR